MHTYPNAGKAKLEICQECVHLYQLIEAGVTKICSPPGLGKTRKKQKLLVM